MTDLELALRYQPIIHFDRAETIPLTAFGYTIFRETRRSASFPKREVQVPEGALVIEYACWWDYDIQHMYDLEHIWVTVKDGKVVYAEGSFHGKYLVLWTPDMPFAHPVLDGHVQAYCQPGKHAFLPDGQMFRIIPGWYESCNSHSGGHILVGGPFGGVYAPTEEENALCERYIRDHLAFEPTMDFSQPMPAHVDMMTWDEMVAWIPGRVAAECARIKELYK